MLVDKQYIKEKLVELVDELESILVEEELNQACLVEGSFCVDFIDDGIHIDHCEGDSSKIQATIEQAINSVVHYGIDEWGEYSFVILAKDTKYSKEEFQKYGVPLLHIIRQLKYLQQEVNLTPMELHGMRSVDQERSDIIHMIEELITYRNMCEDIPFELEFDLETFLTKLQDEYNKFNQYKKCESCGTKLAQSRLLP